MGDPPATAGRRSLLPAPWEVGRRAGSAGLSTMSVASSVFLELAGFEDTTTGHVGGVR